MDESELESQEIGKILDIKIPNTFINVLKANGIFDGKILAGLTTDDIKGMETYMREVLLYVLPKEELVLYYGIFSHKPEIFQFTIGDRKILELLQTYFNKKYSKGDINISKNIEKETNDSLALQKKNISQKKQENSGENSNELLESTTEKEELAVKNILHNWLRNKCTDSQWAIISKKLENIKFSFQTDSSACVFCRISCYCKNDNVFTVYKQSQSNTYRKRWILGNFYRHMMNKHLSNLSRSKVIRKTKASDSVDDDMEPSLEPKKFNRSNTLLNYVQVSKKRRTNEDIFKEDSTSEISIIDDIEGSTKISDNEDNVTFLNRCSDAVPEREKPDICILSDELLRGPISATSTNESKSSLELSPTDGIFVHPYSETDKENISPTHNRLREDPTISKEFEDFGENGISKWKSEKYQRKERSRRKREKLNENQHLITDYYPMIINTIEYLIKNEPDITVEYLNILISCNRDLVQQPNSSGMEMNKFLQILCDICKTNSSTSKNKYNYSIKQFALYMYYIGGRVFYETIHANLKNVVPSITTLNRYVRNDKKYISEGDFDFDGLAKFIEERKLAKYVWIAEDCTRINGKIEYNQRNNKIMGFSLPLSNGIPDINTFTATSGEIIQSYFNEATKAHYACVIMAQPLMMNSPAYCLSIFCTDNKFRAEDVSQRWAFIKQSLFELGVTVLGFSSDGDTRYFKTMRIESELPLPPDRRYLSQ
ncbi:unnamed protein product [Phaedon cochleariae]|uniref:Uncharacterized protein n=1 Tax=Phaedon cochleariae TaxID=80249 RepID=A0A9N9SPA0_PHACE|nr:unnamed protein product [Phaedon cochleariae]